MKEKNEANKWLVKAMRMRANKVGNGSKTPGRQFTWRKAAKSVIECKEEVSSGKVALELGLASTRTVVPLCFRVFHDGR